MKYIYIVFLLLASNGINPMEADSGINGMEAECKSLASFFDIATFADHEDIPKNIALHYVCDKQWWYVDKAIQFIGEKKLLSIEERKNYIKGACFDSTDTKIIAFTPYAKSVVCMWNRDGEELERLGYKASDRFCVDNTEWADKLHNSGNSPWIHHYKDDTKELLKKRFGLCTMLCFHEQQAFIAPQFGVYGGHSVHAWNDAEDKILFSLVHKDIVNSVDFNPQGIEIITASADGTMRLWHQKTGQELLCITYDKRVTSASFNSLGTEMVVATDDGKIEIFAQYRTDNLQQIFLKKLLYVWLQLKKPSKEIDSAEKLLQSIADMLQLNVQELQTTWESFSEHMQKGIWASMLNKIQKYGK